MNELDIAAWLLGIGLLIWGILETRLLWVTRRQPVREDSVINEVWTMPEPRYRRHYERR